MKRLTAAALAVAMLTLAACTPADEPAPAASATSAPAPSVSTGPTPTPTPTAEALKPAGFSTYGIALGPVEGEGLNKRTTLVARDLDHLFKYDEYERIHELVTEKDAMAAHRLASKFVLEKIVDSGQAHTENREAALAWLDDIEVHPSSDFKGEWTEYIKGTKSPFSANFSGRRAPDPERPIKNGAPHSDVSMKVRNANAIPEADAKANGSSWYEPGIGTMHNIGYEVYTEAPARASDPSDTTQYDYHVRWIVWVFMVKDEGAWKIHTYDWDRSDSGVPMGDEPEFGPMPENM